MSTPFEQNKFYFYSSFFSKLKIPLFFLLQVEESFLDVIVYADVKSSVLTVPKTKIIAKKDFTDKEKLIEFGFIVDTSTKKSVSTGALLVYNIKSTVNNYGIIAL